MDPLSEENVKKKEEQKAKVSNSTSEARKKLFNRGAWTEEEDKRLNEVISIHGPKKWQTIAAKAGLDRCGKSCRFRWLNYLRPNIKRGNISDQEEDLILRLHKLLGNRWSLIAGRLPGRTDNEIKNYWNSHLSKKINENIKKPTRNRVSKKEKISRVVEVKDSQVKEEEEDAPKASEVSNMEFDVDDFFDFSNELSNLDWLNNFLCTG